MKLLHAQAEGLGPQLGTLGRWRELRGGLERSLGSWAEPSQRIMGSWPLPLHSLWLSGFEVTPVLTWANRSWTEASQTVRQNKPFLILS